MEITICIYLNHIFLICSILEQDQLKSGFNVFLVSGQKFLTDVQIAQELVFCQIVLYQSLVARLLKNLTMYLNLILEIVLFYKILF